MHARIVPILLRGSRGSVRSSDLSTTTQSRSRIPPAPGSLPPQTRQADVKQENSRSLVQEAGAAGDGRVGTHRAVGPSSWAEVPKASSGRRSGWVRGRAAPGVGTPGGRERAAERRSEREAEGAQAVLGADCEQWGWRRALGRSEGHPRAQGEESNKQTALLWPYRWAGKTHSRGPEGRAGAVDRNERSDRLPGGRRPDLGGGSGTDLSSPGTQPQGSRGARGEAGPLARLARKSGIWDRHSLAPGGQHQSSFYIHRCAREHLRLCRERTRESSRRAGAACSASGLASLPLRCVSRPRRPSPGKSFGAPLAIF